MNVRKTVALCLATGVCLSVAAGCEIGKLNGEGVLYPMKTDNVINATPVGSENGINFYLLNDGSYGARLASGVKDKKITVPAEFEGISVTTILKNFLGDNASVEELVLSSGITKIASEAFSGGENLTSITIPDTVKEIGAYAFSACKKLATIALPETVTSIERGVFLSCEGLTELIIPDTVEEIKSHAFSGCAALENLTLGESVEMIDEYAFFHCEKLSSVTFKNVSGWTADGLAVAEQLLGDVAEAASFLRGNVEWLKTTK